MGKRMKSNRALGRCCRIGVSAGLLGLVALAAPPAGAVSFLGLEPGDVIDTVGFTIASGQADFDDVNDTFDIDATLDDITTTVGSPGGPEVLQQIGGGLLRVRLDLVGESLTHFGFGFFDYVATFQGRAGTDDVQLYSPVSGNLPEQDGRLLVPGEFLSSNLQIQVFFTPFLNLAPTFSIVGTFNVIAGGDATFKQAFGLTGSLADILGAAGQSVPPTVNLVSDGWLFSVRDTNLLACAALANGSACGGTVLNDSGSFTVTSGTGEIVPQNPAPFVPEPGTGLLLGGGLLGLLAVARRLRG